MSPLTHTPGGGEAGFTIMELIVGMAIGLVVSFATFAIIETAMRGQVRIADRIDATQRARTAMEQLVQEFHSACVSPQLGPIFAGGQGVNSDAWNVVFVSGVGSGTSVNLVEHVLALSGSTLVDSTYPQIGGTAPTNWTFSSTPSTTRTVVTNISSSYTRAGGTPIFQYYRYQDPAATPAPANPNSLLGAPAMATPLSGTFGAANQASSVAKVTITLAVGPTSGSTAADRAATLSSGIVLRLTPAFEGTTTLNGPCT